MKRGDLVTVAIQGDYGKPRPAVIVQSDALAMADSVLVALLTTTIRNTPLYRLDIAPTALNGLKAPSQVMADKIMATPRARCGPVIGQLASAEMLALNTMLALVIGVAD